MTNSCLQNLLMIFMNAAMAYLQKRQVLWKEKLILNIKILLAEIQGGHWGPFMYSEDVVRKYERYLVQNGLMDKRYMSC